SLAAGAASSWRNTSTNIPRWRPRSTSSARLSVNSRRTRFYCRTVAITGFLTNRRRTDIGKAARLCWPMYLSIKSHTEETTCLGGVGQFSLQNTRRDVKAMPKSLARQDVRIHRYNVLEAPGLGPFGSELERLGDLTLIDAIK